MGDWHENLLSDSAAIGALVRSARRVAVLGIRPESKADRPAHFVPAYLASAGITVLPVPVGDPGVPVILGQPVYGSVAEAPGPVDIVDVFRRAEDIPPHLPDLLAARPRAVWFQSGIRNDSAAETLARAGIQVVQDRCLMVEHRRWASASKSL
ncbi:MAG: CoA-binding protein [Myxococcales bacterium]